MNEKIVLAVVLVFGIVSIVAVILAAVAVSKPAAIASGFKPSNMSSDSRSSPVVVNCFGKGVSGDDSANSKPTNRNRIYTIALGDDWDAYEYIDKNGYLAGFSLDLITEVCAAAGIDCRTVWEPYKNCFYSKAGQHSMGGQGLMGRWYDACNGYVVTVNRLAIFKFSASYTKSTLGKFIVKKDDTSFNENNIAGKKIGFLDGWATDEKCLFRLYNTLLPENQIVHVNGMENLKDLIVSGQVDAGYTFATHLSEYIDGANPVLKRVGTGKSCMIRGSSMMSRKDNDFPARWNEGFNKIVSNGRYKELCDNAAANHGHKGTVECL